MKERIIDIILENSVELPKAAKSDYPIISSSYDVKGIKVYSDECIVDVEAEIYVTTIYKAIDHTVRWNEHIVQASGSKVLEGSSKGKAFSAQCICVKKLKDSIKSPNIYNYQIYLSIKIDEESDLEFNYSEKRNNHRHTKRNSFGRRSLVEHICKIHEKQVNSNIIHKT